MAVRLYFPSFFFFFRLLGNLTPVYAEPNSALSNVLIRLKPLSKRHGSSIIVLTQFGSEGKYFNSSEKLVIGLSYLIHFRHSCLVVHFRQSRIYSPNVGQ